MSSLPARATGAVSLAIGDSLAGRIDFNGDRDWVRIDVPAGEWLQVTQQGVGADALDDAFLRVYDARGTLITTDDEQTTSTTDQHAAALFGGSDGGTYYIEAGAFRDRSDGDYSLSATYITTPRGNPVQTLDTGRQRSDTMVTVHFVESGARADYGWRTGDQQDDLTSEGWNNYERARAMEALASISAVANIRFVESDNPRSDFQLVLDRNELKNASLLGYFYLPNGTQPSVGVLNGSGVGWDNHTGGGLEEGGLGYGTLVHEFLHGLGLGHPHDGGGVIPGVHRAFRDLGINGLNQGIATTMSYNRGNETIPEVGFNSGYEAGPMALDIAALQRLYGANDSTGAGDDTYVIDDSNGNLAWRSIWDTGGYDTILYSGSRDTTIDLRAATLDYTFGGGGFASYAAGRPSGFTIANGVVIEAAEGGFGNDWLVANGFGSSLTGGAGNDRLIGGMGDDTLLGGADDDTLTGGAGDDMLSGGDGDDTANGGAGADTITGGIGDDQLAGGSGADTISVASGTNTIDGGSGADRLTGGAGADTIHGNGGNDQISGGGAGDWLHGGRGQDQIVGGDGDDRIVGGWGADTLTGGTGADTFIFEFASDSGAGAGLRDQITDFQNGVDLIDLSTIDADITQAEHQGFTLIGASAFSAAGQIRIDTQDGGHQLQADRDGDGAADMEIWLQGITSVSSGDFVL